MAFLRSVFFPRKAHRHFALLDAAGHCQAFKHCELPPMGDGWVEIDEVRLIWLHKPLPASARISPPATRPRGTRALTI